MAQRIASPIHSTSISISVQWSFLVLVVIWQKKMTGYRESPVSVIEKCVVSWSPLEQTKPFFPFTVMPLLPFSFFPLRNAVMKRLPFGRDG